MHLLHSGSSDIWLFRDGKELRVQTPFLDLYWSLTSRNRHHKDDSLSFPRACPPNGRLLSPPSSSSSSSLSLALMHYFAINKYLSQVSHHGFIMVLWNKQNFNPDEEETKPHKISVMCLRSLAHSFESQDLSPRVLTFSNYPGSFYSSPQPTPQPWALGCQELLVLDALPRALFLLALLVIPGAPCPEEFRTCCGYL